MQVRCRNSVKKGGGEIHKSLKRCKVIFEQLLRLQAIPKDGTQTIRGEAIGIKLDFIWDGKMANLLTSLNTRVTLFINRRFCF